MSTNNRILVLIGLTVVGSLGLAARDDAGADEPKGASAAADRSPQREQYLLLNNGQLVQGIVSEQESAFVVVQRVGVMKFPKNRVEGAFDSLLEAYQYKREQLPERDSDERFKLARWCLNHKLTEQAREQLTKVLDLNSKHVQAQAMLTSIDQEAVRIAQRQRDPEVRQTRAESTMAEDRPGALDSAVIQGAQQHLGISGLPVIFDLPRPLAVKRAQEFARFVHPLLQAYCARCHNGDYEGRFQLVTVRNRADRTPDALRANLDATLQFIDSQNPAKSELLSTMLLPHGRGPNKRPIFPGSNNQAYQVISTWVNNLRSSTMNPPSSKTGGDVIQASSGRTRTGEGEGEGEAFAVDRDRPARELSDPGAQELPGGSERPSPAGRNATEPLEFPLPFAVGGGRPRLPSTKPAAAQSMSRPSERSPIPPPSIPPVLTNAGSDTSPRSGAPPDAAKTPAEAATPSKSEVAKKPLKIDPSLLQRALESRNLNR